MLWSATRQTRKTGQVGSVGLWVSGTSSVMRDSKRSLSPSQQLQLVVWELPRALYHCLHIMLLNWIKVGESNNNTSILIDGIVSKIVSKRHSSSQQASRYMLSVYMLLDWIRLSVFIDNSASISG